jgi:hypothetical protein
MGLTNEHHISYIDIYHKIEVGKEEEKLLVIPSMKLNNESNLSIGP